MFAFLLLSSFLVEFVFLFICYKDKVGNNIFLFKVKRFCAIVKVSSQALIEHFNHMAP